MDDLAITIGNLGSYQYLGSCLNSVYQEDDPALTYTVIVGFNGFEGDEIVRRLQHDFPAARFVRRRNKLGYTGIYNLLMRSCEARYILILDEDTIVPRGTLPAMVRFMDDHPEVGIAGCKALNPDGSFQKSYGVMFNLCSEFLNALHVSTFWPEHIYQDIGHWKPVDWLNGSFMLVPRETLQEVGGLDDHFYTFSCEADWCLRIARAGWKVAFVPDVSIMHVGGDHSINSAAKSYNALMRSHINRYFFFRKHYGFLYQALLRPVMSVGALLRLGKYLLLYLASPSRRAEAGPKIRAYARVFLLGFSPHPWRLTPVLQRDNELASKAR